MTPQLQAPVGRGRWRIAISGPRPALDAKAVALRLVLGWVAIWGLISLLGLLETRVLNTGPVHAADLGVDVWLAAHRTPVWNGITHVGTSLATTMTVICVTAAVALALRWLLGRWHESLALVTVMVGEILLFLAASSTIHQDRPPVPRLDRAPPTSSYPSGHTAASTALYGCLAVLVIWIYGRRPAARVVAGVLAFLPVFVAFSRMYRGMHYPSDVIAGALLGGLWLLLVVRTLLLRATPPQPVAGPGARRRRRR
ncbi:MAG TPA: phosphatase PAP2 family protein [Streptosporangiaceae bacterium]|jgi:undecaprenyl-diphosphatase|nr:phosphatase PAP2 family protein [Streptosporangiaceae bacterium]